MCLAPDPSKEQVQFPNGLIRRADGTELRPGDPEYPIQVGPGVRRLGPTDVPLRDGMAGAAREAILTRRQRIAEALGEE